MAEMVDQKLFTQEELIELQYLSDLALAGEEWAGVLVRMVRRLALRISQLQELVEANGS